MLIVTEAGLKLLFPEGIRSNQLYGWEWLTEDPVLGWRNQPGYRHPHFQINSMGQRGPEIERKKPENTLRILCLGDSRTFGIRQAMGKYLFDNDYPSILQALISERSASKRVEVLNAGVIGYTSAHGLRALQCGLLEMEPDILVVAFGFNEFLLSWTPEKRIQEPVHPLTRRLFYSLLPLRTFQLLLSGYRKLPFLHPRPAERRWVTQEEYARHLRRFVEIARENTIRIVFLNQPLRDAALGETIPALPSKEMSNSYQIMGVRDRGEIDHYLKLYDTILFNVAARMGVPVVDGASAFGKKSDFPLFDPYDLVHANRHGAQVLAEALLGELARLGYVE